MEPFEINSDPLIIVSPTVLLHEQMRPLVRCDKQVEKGKGSGLSAKRESRKMRITRLGQSVGNIHTHPAGYRLRSEGLIEALLKHCQGGFHHHQAAV